MANDGNEEDEERLVVVVADAIVEPDAVMVELLSAPLASAAVLRVLFDIRVAVVAVELESAVVELLVRHPVVPFDAHGHVARVRHGRDQAEHEDDDVERQRNDEEEYSHVEIQQRLKGWSKCNQNHLRRHVESEEYPGEELVRGERTHEAMRALPLALEL